MMQNRVRSPQNQWPRRSQNRYYPRRMPYPNQRQTGFMSNGRQGNMIGRLLNNAIRNPIDSIGKMVNIIKILT